MDQSLLTSRGASEKPSKYRPVWTDRFFTGYFTNRSPFRSPLSAFYAQGWQLGRTDTLIDGANVEISPALTLIRRPGCAKWNALSTLPLPPYSFYSFHRQDGNIMMFADLPNAIYQVSADGSVWGNAYSKPNPGSGRRSYFYGLGNTLYVADGVNSIAMQTGVNGWQNVIRNMGIAAPMNAPAMSITQVNTATTQCIGAQFDGSTAYITTTNQITNPNQWTFEAWINTSANSVPIASFESNQTGESQNVYHTIYIDADGHLAYGVWDSSFTFLNAQADSNVRINDGQWHHISISFTYSSTIYEAVVALPGLNIKGTTVGQGQFNPDPTSLGNFTYTSTPTVSSGGTPANCQAFMFVDGQYVMDAVIGPLGGFPSTAKGYWRLGYLSRSAVGTVWPDWKAIPTSAYFSGKMAYVSIYNGLVGGVGDRYANAITGGMGGYATRTTQFNPAYFWQLQESSGTSAGDSADSNAGTYQGTFTLHQTAPLIYVTYAPSVAYTQSQMIVDSNGYLQQVSVPGTSGATAPSWNKTLGGATTDGTVTWINRGQAALNLATATGTKYCFCYVNKNGHFSTASPLTSATGPQTGVHITVTGPGSWDPQVANVAIFRTPDGGSTPFYVAAVPISPGSGWTFVDSTPDSSLNILMAAPRDHSNDPPPQGLINLVYHQGRMWGSVGGTVYASGGEDTLVGDGNEAWPPSSCWVFPSLVVRLISTSSGLVVITTSGIHMLAGGPAIAQYYPQELLPRIGVSSYNAVDINGSRIVLFTSDKQLLSIDPSTGVSDLGFPIGDKLAQWDPANVYVAYHQSGLDNAVYIADGQTGWYRCSPQQPPDYQITGPVWSPKATINDGFCGAIASVETSPGTYELLVGDVRDNGSILARDSGYSVYEDAGQPYSDAFFTLGNIVLANPGEIAKMAFVTADFAKVGSQPTVSVLIDEITGDFTSISDYVVTDPPMLYGTTQPGSLYSNRYYFGQSQEPAWCRHLQIKVDYGADTVKNEIYTMTIFGTIVNPPPGD